MRFGGALENINSLSSENLLFESELHGLRVKNCDGWAGQSAMSDTFFFPQKESTIK